MDYTIKTDRLLLQPLKEADFSFMQELESRPESYQYESSEYKSPEDIKKECLWYIEREKMLPNEGAIRWIAKLLKAPIGEVHLKCNWEATFEWEIGYMFLSEYWGKGFATEAVNAAIHHAFHNFKINRIAAFLNAENKRSVALVERAGMRQDGRMREVRFINSIFYDEYVYSILKREYFG